MSHQTLEWSASPSRGTSHLAGGPTSSKSSTPVDVASCRTRERVFRDVRFIDQSHPPTYVHSVHRISHVASCDGPLRPVELTRYNHA